MAQPEPLQRFFGAYKPTEAEMRQMLTDAADEAERTIPKLLEQNPNSLKAAQLQLILREVHAQQRALWGDLGVTIRDGMERSAYAATAGESVIDRYLRRAGLDMPDLRASFRAQAKRGFENVLAKGFNNIPLSKQVYKTQALAMGWIDRKIRTGLILQTSAKELAKQVRDFIDPNVKGGVSFAAFRLARTELNNAFHTTAIARADEPWATGMGWHLSGSHPPHPPGRPEVCETYARTDNGLGVGVFPRGKVPSKPHPQCLCYVTQEVVDEDTFIDKLLAGDYDEHLGHKAEVDPPKKDPALAFLDATAKDPANSTASLLNELVNKYGVSREDAKGMLAVYRPPKGKPARAKPPKATVVPLDPEQRPARPPKGVPGQGQHTGPIKSAKSIPKREATPAPLPSQPTDKVKQRIQDITEFQNRKPADRRRVVKALEHQAGFAPKSVTALNGVKEMDSTAPSFGQPGIMGEYDLIRQMIFINGPSFLPQAENVFAKEKSTNYISKCGQQFDSMDALIAHEFGHHVHDRWINGSSRQKKEGWTGLARVLGVPPPRNFGNEGLLEWGEKHKTLIANSVSKYGSTNVLEMMAEVWAEYTLGDPPRSHISDMGEVLQKLAEERA